MRDKNTEHEPVLLEEVLEAFGMIAPLKEAHSKVFIDATLGFGGHTRRLLESKGIVLGIDLDQESLDQAESRLSDACPVPQSDLGDQHDKCFYPVQGNFAYIDKIAIANGFAAVDGILVDLGVNTPQLTSKTRGMSFQNPNADLDMRLDNVNQGVKANDLLNALNVTQLERMFMVVCGRNESKRLAKTVLKSRKKSRIQTVGDFLGIVNEARVGMQNPKTHPATQAFLALRIAVNSELDNIVEMIPKAFNLLNIGGKLAIISFHSEEDKLVKDGFKRLVDAKLAKLITNKPIVPSEKEVSENPKSRSAKLRVLERIE